MKTLIFSTVFSGLFIFSSTLYAQNQHLIGSWKLADLLCENPDAPRNAVAPLNEDIRKGAVALSSKSTLTFKEDGHFTFSMKGADDCALETVGTYKVKSPDLIETYIGRFNSNCYGKYQVGEQKIDYAMHGEDLLLYQPLGYMRDQLCGKSARAIQVLRKQQPNK